MIVKRYSHDSLHIERTLILTLARQGMYAGDDYIDPNALPTFGYEYVTAMLKGRYCEFEMKGGRAAHRRDKQRALLSRRR